jgi:uncharacterized protein YjbI with pentapeptide repeats
VIVRSDDILSVGWKVGSVAPPDLSLTVIAKSVFPLTQRVLKAKVSPPGVRGDRFIDENDPFSELLYPSDVVPFKPNTDVLVVGDAHAPEGKPVHSMTAGLSIAGIRKSLLVVGDRSWMAVPGDSQRKMIGDSAAFVKIPLERARSFGGSSGGKVHAKNPLGRGADLVQLPNFEDPSRRIATELDVPEPIGFGPVPAHHHPRAAMGGTYDDAYVKTHWPWMPADVDWRYFNAAAIDQQATGYLRGDELLRLNNLVEGDANFWTHLPGLRVRWVMRIRKKHGGMIEREAEMNLDTVVVDTRAGEVTIVWRGVVPAPSMKLSDVESMFATAEKLGEHPRSTDELWKVFEERRSAEDQPPPEAAAELARAEAEIAEMDAKADANWQKIEEMQGLQMAKANKAISAKKERDHADGGVGGMKPERLDGAADAISGGAEALAGAAHDASIAAGAGSAPFVMPESPLVPRIRMLKEQLATMQQSVSDSNDERIVNMTKAIASLEALDAEQGRSLIKLEREHVVAMVKRGENFAEISLESKDLSGLDLSGVDFSGAVFAEANLSGANLSGATLRGAVFYKANLTDADLTGAICDEAIFSEANLTGAKLTGLSVADAVFIEQDLRGRDLTGWRGHAPDLTSTKLDGATFGAADVPGAVFMFATMHHVDLAGANLRDAEFLGVQGQGMDFSNVQASGMRASPDADLRFSNFRGACAIKANLKAARLDGSDFSDAVMLDAILAEASISHAVFRRADLAGADFSDSDLSRSVFEDSNIARAMLERCDVRDAEFRRVNAWSTGFWMSEMSSATVEACNLRRSSLA